MDIFTNPLIMGIYKRPNDVINQIKNAISNNLGK